MSWAEDEGIDGYDEDFVKRMRSMHLMVDEDTFREYWMTKEGARIYIEDMKTSHIKNILKGRSDGRFVLGEVTLKRLVLELSIRRRFHQQDMSEIQNIPF